jgi:hypothetical protein
LANNFHSIGHSLDELYNFSIMYVWKHSSQAYNVGIQCSRVCNDQKDVQWSFWNTQTDLPQLHLQAKLSAQQRTNKIIAEGSPTFAGGSSFAALIMSEKGDFCFGAANLRGWCQSDCFDVPGARD